MGRTVPVSAEQLSMKSLFSTHAVYQEREREREREREAKATIKHIGYEMGNAIRFS